MILVVFFLFLKSLRKHVRAIYCNISRLKMVIFRWKNVTFFAQNIDRGYTLEPHQEAVQTITHNLCFRAKYENNVYPCKPQFYYIKM